MFEKVLSILRDYTEVPVSSISPDTRLAEDLGFNSLDLMSIVVAFEDEFDIEIPEEDALKMHTVSDVVQYLQDAVS